MKKIFLLLAIAFLSIGICSANEIPTAANTNTVDASAMQQKHHEMHRQREIAFEQRLGLTEEQKLQARELRKAGHEKLKPLITKFRQNEKEISTIKNTRIAVQLQEEKIAPLEAENKVLEQQIHKIKKDNMKDFEKILTKDQKNILQQMKKEGRSNKCEHSKTSTSK